MTKIVPAQAAKHIEHCIQCPNYRTGNARTPYCLLDIAAGKLEAWGHIPVWCQLEGVRSPISDDVFHSGLGAR